MTLSFEFLSFRYLNKSIFALRQIPCDNIVGLIPLISSYIHLKGFDKLTGIDVVLLSKIKLSNFSVVFSDSFVIGSGNFRRLAWDELNSFVPFASTKSSFNSFVKNVSLNIMINSLVKLLLRHEPITPFLFQMDNMSSESTFGQFNCFSISMTINIRIKSSIKDIHLFKEITGLFVHARWDQLSRNLFKLILRNRNIVCRDNIGSLSR